MIPLRRFCHDTDQTRVVVLSAGILLTLGCGGSETAGPVETAQTNPAPPPGPHGAPAPANTPTAAPGPSAPTGHGGPGGSPPAGSSAPTGHGAPGAQYAPPGASAPTGHGARGPSGSMSQYAPPSGPTGHSAPSGHGAPGASAPQYVPPGASGPSGHSAPSAHGAPGGDGNLGVPPGSTPRYVPPSGPSGHDAPGQSAPQYLPPGEPGTTNAATPQGKPTTGGWLAGMANAVFGGESSGSQPHAEGEPSPYGEPAGYPEGYGAPGLAGEPGEMPYPGAGYGENPYGPAGAGQAIPGQQKERPKFEEGSPEYAVQQVLLKMKAGTTDGMSELISPDTNSDFLVPLRDGTATREEIAKAQQLVQGIQFKRKRKVGQLELFYFFTPVGRAITLTTRFDSDIDEHRVTNIKIEETRRFRRQQQQRQSK